MTHGSHSQTSSHRMGGVTLRPQTCSFTLLCKVSPKCLHQIAFSQAYKHLGLGRVTKLATWGKDGVMDNPAASCPVLAPDCTNSKLNSSSGHNYRSHPFPETCQWVISASWKCHSSPARQGSEPQVLGLPLPHGLISGVTGWLTTPSS